MPESATHPPVRQTIDLEVRYAETDQMGVVHHSNYLIWFEQARTALCARTGQRYADIERRGLILMVTGAELSYRQPSRYGDTVQVTAWVEELSRRTVTFGYEVAHGGRRLATGKTRHIWLRQDTGRPSSVPDDLWEAFLGLAQSGS